jgi:hypothetical protein
MLVVNLIDRLGAIRQRLANISITVAQLVGEVDLVGQELATLSSSGPPIPQIIQSEWKDLPKNRSRKKVKAKMVSCPKCDYEGPSRDALWQHKKTHHPETIQSKKKKNWKPRKFSVKKIQKIMEDAKTLSTKDVCKKFKVAPYNIYRWKKQVENGITLTH